MADGVWVRQSDWFCTHPLGPCCAMSGSATCRAVPAAAHMAGQARERRAQAMAVRSATGISVDLLVLVTPLPADGEPVPGEIIEHQQSAVYQGQRAVLVWPLIRCRRPE